MRTFRRTTVAILGAALVLLVFLNMYVLDDRLSGVVSGVQIPWASRLFEKFGVLGALAQMLRQYRTLALDANALKDERQLRVQAEALLRDVQEENAFLKRSLDVKERLQRPMIPASVFSSLRTPLGHTLLVNRGSAQGVTVGDIVATPVGALVGQINAVFADTATVRLLSNPGFEVAARIAGTETVGLARGTGKDTLSLEFIVQTDPVQEGDAIVTSGDDRFPPALAIGSVEHVQAGQAQLFKDIRIVPAMSGLRFGRVLIIQVR